MSGSLQIIQKHLSGGILDPDIKACIEEIKKQNAPLFEDIPVADARIAALSGISSMNSVTEDVHSVEDIEIDLVTHKLNARIYTPAGDGPFPVLVYYHGGGWVICNLDTHDSPCRSMCNLVNCIVVSVDYRLAPEHPFPAAADDAYAAAKWVHQNIARYNGDPNRIAVGGDSAGGNLSAVTSIKAKENGDLPLVFQMLIYPVTNMVSFDTDSYSQYAEGYFLTKSMMEWFRRLYMGSASAESPYASPLLADDLSGLPPALVVTAEFDPLRDEGEAYAKRLHEAGVSVQCSRYNGMIHPFWGMGGITSQAKAAHREAAECLKRAFG